MTKKSSYIIAIVLLAAAAIVFISIFSGRVDRNEAKGTVIEKSQIAEINGAAGICTEEIFTPRRGEVEINGIRFAAENRYNLATIYKGDRVQVIKALYYEGPDGKCDVEVLLVAKVDGR